MVAKACANRSRRRRRRDDADEIRARILSGFSERAKRSGIRSVVMGELASDLRMSASTLYEHFASKEDLVAAMVDHWCADLATRDALSEDERLPMIERFTIWADTWSLRIIQYSPAFWRDLARDHPALWTRMQRDLDQRKAAGVALMAAHLRADLVPAAAFGLLHLIYDHAHDPRLCDELGVARRDSVRTALSIWARGALKVPAGRRPRRR